MIKVYHNPEYLTYQYHSTMCHENNSVRVLYLAAKVDTDSVSVAYAATQNFDAEVEHSIVKEYRVDNRSTSIGDVLELNGIYYVVESIGFEVLPEEAIDDIAFCVNRESAEEVLELLRETED